MRVLKVTGENIASLAGPFELDLESGPIARAGLFAITGPTGAGKSSLLDAMCLALFDQTPRLLATKKVLVGAEGEDVERLQSDDVRGLLTRGCAAGWAEVLFEGVDGQRYAARWSVRRARNKPTGKLQKQDVTLRCADTGEALGAGTRGKTLDEIKARLGLDFDQFRRSVFLAQGAFAEFLHASNKERGELLERMTGTTLYAQVSMAAFARAKQERDEFARLTGQQGSLVVLDAEARGALDAALAAARTQLDALTKRAHALKLEHAWHERLGALRADAREARAELRQHLAAWARYEPPGWVPPALEPLVAGAAVSGAPAVLAPDTGAPLAAGLAAELLTQTPFELAARQRLDAATALDVRVAEREQALSKLVQRSAVAGEGVAALDVRGQALRLEVAACHERVAQASMWLAAHAAVAPWAAQWALCERELRAMVEGLTARVAHAASLLKVEAALPAAVVRVEKAGTEHVAVSERLSAARAAVVDVRKLAETPDRPSLRARRENLERRLRALDELGEGLALERKLAARAEQERIRARDARAALLHTQAEESRARVQLETERGARRRVESMLSLDARRAELVRGEPCPLCGAQEHPYAAHAPAVEALLTASQTAERDAQERCDALTLSMGEQAAIVASSQRAVSTHEQERVELRARLVLVASSGDAHDVLGVAHAAGDGEAADTASAVDAELAARRAAAVAQCSQTDVAIQEAEQLVQQLDAARAAVEAAQAGLDLARSERDAARQAHDALWAEHQRLVQEQARAEHSLQRARAELGAYVAPETWEPALLTDPVAFVAGLAERVRAWSAQHDAHGQAERALPEKQAAAAGCEQLLAGAQARLAELAAERDAAEQAQAADVAARRALFEGASAKAVEATLAALRAGLVRAAERDRSVATHLGQRPAPLPEVPHEPHVPVHPEGTSEALAQLDARAGVLGAQLSAAQRDQSALDNQRAVDDQQRQQKAALGPAIEAQRTQMEGWERLNVLIGKADGSKFRDFAQGLSLQLVMAYANQQLEELRPRYRLAAVPGSNLDMQVVDRDMGDEVRPIASLSGGETFLVSLALALGLAESIGGTRVVDSLFIDEGFGALDAEAMEVALTALDALQASGRVVGVVSHVEGLAERVGIHVRVEPIGGGHSRVRVVQAGV